MDIEVEELKTLLMAMFMVGYHDGSKKKVDRDIYREAEKMIEKYQKKKQKSAEDKINEQLLKM